MCHASSLFFVFPPVRTSCCCTPIEEVYPARKLANNACSFWAVSTTSDLDEDDSPCSGRGCSNCCCDDVVGDVVDSAMLLLVVVMQHVVVWPWVLFLCRRKHHGHIVCITTLCTSAAHSHIANKNNNNCCPSTRHADGSLFDLNKVALFLVAFCEVHRSSHAARYTRRCKVCQNHPPAQPRFTASDRCPGLVAQWVCRLSGGKGVPQYLTLTPHSPHTNAGPSVLWLLQTMWWYCLTSRGTSGTSLEQNQQMAKMEPCTQYVCTTTRGGG